MRTKYSELSTSAKLEPRLAEKLSVRDWCLLQLCKAGLTPKEIVYLKHSDCDFKTGVVRTVRKRAIHLDQQTLELLFCIASHNQRYIFSTIKSPRLRERSLRKVMEKYQSVNSGGRNL